MSGEMEIFYSKLRQDLLSIMSKIEAYIDFPDEDGIPDNIIKNIQKEVTDLINKIEQTLSDERGKRIREGFHIAIIGAPNTGKSTLLNHLAKKDAAIISNISGTTRDVIEINLDIAGYPVTLADTAGIRHTKFIDTIEQEGIKRSLKTSEKTDLKLILFDIWKLPKIDSEIKELIDKNTICIAR